MSRAVAYRAHAGPGVADAPGVPDEYWDRFIKYVPAEAITFVLAVTSIGEGTGAPDRGLTLTACGLGLVIALLAALLALRKQDPAQRKPLRFITFSLVAYAFWLIGMAGLLEALQITGAPVWMPRVLLLFGVFTVPLADLVTER